jgi:ATP-binding cassette subfamily B protein
MPSIDSILLQKVINILESFSDNDAPNLLNYILLWAIIYGGWWECINITWRSYDYLYLKTMPLIKGRILDEVYNYTQYHSHKFFQSNLAGHITNRITESSRSFEMIFAIIVEKIIHKIAVIIFAFITMFSVNAIFAKIFAVWIIFFVGISVFCARLINKYSTSYARNKSLVAGKIVDSIANIAAIRMFTSHKFERNYLKTHIDSTIKSEQKMQFFMFRLRYVLGTSCSIMICAMIYYLAYLRSHIKITIGDCVLIISLCAAVAEHIWELTQDIGDMFEELGSFNQSMSLITPYIINDIKDAEIINVTEGEIKFCDVTFNYLNNVNKSSGKNHYSDVIQTQELKDISKEVEQTNIIVEKPGIFQNKSIIIQGKQKIGLVGFSGSGKTTFVNLITRLYDVSSGAILIDGQNIKNITQDSLHDNISIIPQEPILFHRTIIENIRYGKKNATDDEVVDAAKMAHAHEFIINLPEGYNNLCGERGNNLSGGQRQRIAIARAILKNAPILILDEATSSLDSTTENLIQESLKYLMQNKTVIVIAHRLSTLLNMDRILVFDKGAIAEEGTHEALLKKAKLYKKLWNSQVKGLIAESP